MHEGRRQQLHPHLSGEIGRREVRSHQRRRRLLGDTRGVGVGLGRAREEDALGRPEAAGRDASDRRADDHDSIHRREEGDGVRGDVDAIRSEAQDERPLGTRACHEAIAQERC